MPFRRYFANRGAPHPLAYSMLTLAAGMLVCMIIAVTISVQASNRAIRESEQGQCETLQADVDAYTEVPPSSPAGIRQMQSKMERLRQLQCPKGREEQK
jgi:hypothetical protein